MSHFNLKSKPTMPLTLALFINIILKFQILWTVLRMSRQVLVVRWWESDNDFQVPVLPECSGTYIYVEYSFFPRVFFTASISSATKRTQGHQLRSWLWVQRKKPCLCKINKKSLIISFKKFFMSYFYWVLCLNWKNCTIFNNMRFFEMTYWKWTLLDLINYDFQVKNHSNLNQFYPQSEPGASRNFSVLQQSRITIMKLAVIRDLLYIQNF